MESAFILHNIFALMEDTTRLWAAQQDQILLDLIDLLQVDSKLNWKLLTLKFNQTFLQTPRTSKECKQRALQLRPQGSSIFNSLWTQPELNLLKSMYIEQGSSWHFISKSLQSKSENNIKNKFYWILKKASNQLGEYIKKERKSKGLNSQWKINFGVVRVLLDLCNQIKKWADQRMLFINRNCKLFTFRKEIIQYCFVEQSFTELQTEILISKIKEVSSSFRSFKFFKVSNIKHFKVDEYFINKIQQHDNIFNQQMKPSQLLKQPTKASIKKDQEICILRNFSQNESQMVSLSIPIIESDWNKTINLRDGFSQINFSHPSKGAEFWQLSME